MTREEENRIIQEVLSGNTDRFEALVTANQKGVYNHALRMLGNEQDALDAAQDAFFRAYRSLATFRGESRFSVWLYRLVSNICFDMLRKRPSEPDLAITDENGETMPIPDSRFTPQSELEKKELRLAVRNGLAKLPPDFRQILILREIDGLSYDEIARVTGLETGTVKSRIFRARKKLITILMKDGNFSDLSTSFISAADLPQRGGSST